MNELTHEMDELSKELTQQSNGVDPEGQPVREIDPEDDRDNWPVIQVDYEDGKPNFEFVSVSGTKRDGKPFTHDLRIMRGVDVPVPPSIVNMLRTTKRTNYHQTRDIQTGRNVMHKQDRPPIPWRLIEKGKYID